MKKQISRRLIFIITATMLLTLVMNYFVQIQASRDEMIRNSGIKINQIQGILNQNAEDTEMLKDSLKEDYIIRAKAAAYIIQNHPEIIEDYQEMRKVAALFQVDEFHVFDENGLLYAGSEPKYYGLTFNSGEQMQYFLPILKDKSLEMVQDVTPNTAEGKLMQYIAVWQEDGSNIIQIGMEPVRLLKAMEKNELPYIFSMVTPEEGSTLFVIDKETGTILGSSEQDLTNCSMEEAGIVLPETVTETQGFRSVISGKENYCVFRDCGDQYIGVAQENSVVYRNVMQNMGMVCLYLVIIAVVMIVSILKDIDKLVIRGIDTIIDKLTDITGGNLDTQVHVNSSPEFVKLSSHINQMVGSLLGGTEKLTRIFRSADIQIGVYEYNQSMKRVLATEKVGTLLMLSPQETAELLADRRKFAEKIREICVNEVKCYKETYQPLPGTEYYLRIQQFSQNHDCMGIITDVTEELLERRQLEHERDYDLLTELLNRRGFYHQMDLLSENREELGEAVMLMMDLDHLKYINDNFGHINGDLAIQAAAELLKQCEAENKIIARLSGDEFILFIYGCTRREAENHLQRLHDRMMEKFICVYEETKVEIRLSGGYLFCSGPELNCSQMMKQADAAMYQSKRERKARFVEYQSD